MTFFPILLLFFVIYESDAECRDLVPCQRAAGYCRMPHLVRTLSINCPATCGYCQQQTPSNPVQPPITNPNPPVQNPGNGFPGNPYPNPGNGNNNPYPNPYPNYPNPNYPNPPNNGYPVGPPNNGYPTNPNPPLGQPPLNPPIYQPPVNPPPVNPPPINTNPPNPPTGPPKFKYPKYKLHYFDIRFRAEPARLMFHYKKVPFKDIKVSEASYTKKSLAYTDDKYPILEIDNIQLQQSMTIYRYLGHKLGMFGNDELETAYLDYIAEMWRDFVDKTMTYKFVATKVFSGNEKSLHDKTFIPLVQKYWPEMERLLARSTSGFFGSTISWVDFYVAGTVQTFTYLDPTTALGYTKLIAHNDKIYKLQELKPYFKKSPPTGVL